MSCASDPVGICIPGVITCPGLGDGEAVGICMPGVITWPGLGDGEGVGITMPGVITCGLGEGEGLGFVARLAGGRLARVTAFFFLGAVLGFGFAAGLGMTCPSCCGNTLMVSAHIKASALSVRSAILKLLGRFIIPPYMVRQSERSQAVDLR
ncbi:MAG: hypothetical protein AABN95_15085 [Acidobacteriota bacterium]